MSSCSGRGAIRDAGQQVRHRYPKTSDTSPAAHLARLERDPIQSAGVHDIFPLPALSGCYHSRPPCRRFIPSNSHHGLRSACVRFAAQSAENTISSEYAMAYSNKLADVVC
jgi:hypothetical protein